MQPQKTSFIKRTGQSAKGQFQSMHLAVYPFQVQFLKDIDSKIIFYFEKSNQIIGINGQHTIVCPPQSKGSKYLFDQPNYLINFRLHSQKNVVYKWSIYKLLDSGVEQYLQSCTFSLKQLVTNFIGPLKSQSIKSVQSFIAHTFNQKEVRAKFSQNGIILNFALLLSTDPRQIIQLVDRKYRKDRILNIDYSKIYIIQNDAQQCEKKVPVIIDIDIKQDDYDAQNSLESISMLSEVPLISDHQKSKQPDKMQVNGIELDDIILQSRKKGSNEENIQQNALNGSERQDLHFGFYKTQNEMKQIEGQKDYFRRDYSLLKLESDNIKKEAIDQKLQEQELHLDPIEEEKNSNKETIRSYHLKPIKQYKNNTTKLKPLDIQIQQNSQFGKLKKLLFGLIIAIFIVIFITTLPKKIKRKQIDRHTRD